ncbi:hypothetical protein CBL_10329 [Carabus blaptoides fortunei]
MVNGIADSLKEAKGLLKLFEAIFCLLGAIGISALTSEWIYVTYTQLILFTIALAGGCFVALALLISYVESKDNHIGELIFTMTYGILNIIVGILSSMNLDSYGINRGISSIFVPLTAFIAGILFIIDFIREITK